MIETIKSKGKKMVSFILALCATFIPVLIFMFGIVGSVIVSTLSQLEHQQFTEVVDGKEEIRLRLLLGPFSYTINIPERKLSDEEETKN